MPVRWTTQPRITYREYLARMAALTAEMRPHLRTQTDRAVSDEAARLDGVHFYGEHERDKLRLAARIPKARHRAARRLRRSLRAAEGLV